MGWTLVQRLHVQNFVETIPPWDLNTSLELLSLSLLLTKTTYKIFTNVGYLFKCEHIKNENEDPWWDEKTCLLVNF